MLYTIEGKKNKDKLPYDEVIRKTKRSIVTTNGEVVFKEYTKDEHDFNKFNIQVFKVMRSIKSPNLIELYDGYVSCYKKYLLSLILKEKYLNAYTAKFYKKNNTHILLRDTEYVLDNLRRLDQLINEFNKEQIICDDVHASNVVMTDDDIVIIDPDMFYINKRKSSIESLKFNKWVIIHLFSELFCQSNAEFSIHLQDVHHLFDMDLTATTDIVKTVSKRLEPFNKPIDYFYKKRNK